MGEYYPEALRLALDLKGWTQTELSARSGLSKGTLIRILSQRGEFSQPDAERIAFACNLPLSFFARRIHVIDPKELTFRKKSTTTKREERRASASMSILADMVPRLMLQARVKLGSNFLDNVAPSRIVSSSDINAVAVRTREALGLSPDKPVKNVTWAVEGHGIAVVPLKASTNPNDRFKTDGVSRPTIPRDSPLIGVFDHGQPGDRIRFTVAHELGHLVLHRKRVPATKGMGELEANAFASSFLMPDAIARKIISPDMSLIDYGYAKAGWGISIQALITHAARLGVITPVRQRNLMMELSKRGWRKHEPVQVEREEPLLLRQMMGTVFGTMDSPSSSTVDPSILSDALSIGFSDAEQWAGKLSISPEVI